MESGNGGWERAGSEQAVKGQYHASFELLNFDLDVLVQPFGAAVGTRVIEGFVPGPPATPSAPSSGNASCGRTMLVESAGS